MNIPGFIEERTLGKGSYGTVYKATREVDNQSYAVKVVNTAKFDMHALQEAVNEIRLMASFDSPFIVSFCEAFCVDSRLVIVTEYAQLGDLSHMIERRKYQQRSIAEDTIWRFLIQLLKGLSLLHQAGVVHRDIKAANILLCAPDLIKIGDLGISTVLRTRNLAKTQIGTPLYLAPEIWKKHPYDEKCDMWSLGVVLYEMMNFSFPFTANSTDELSRRVYSGKYPPIRGGYSTELQQIVKSLLLVSPTLRPTSTQLLNSNSIKKRLHLIEQVVESRENEVQELLATIKVPNNIRLVAFPAPAYEKEKAMVKPMAQRFHMKGGAKNIQMDQMSTRELQMVADHDWWSPVKQTRVPVPPPPQIPDSRSSRSENSASNGEPPKFSMFQPPPKPLYDNRYAQWCPQKVKGPERYAPQPPKNVQPPPPLWPPANIPRNPRCPRHYYYR